jgi:hypothetical protein
MTIFRIAASAAATFSLISSASAGITIGPVRGQPGESVRLVTFSETRGGTIQKSSVGKTVNGTVAITRERDLVWTFRAPAADGTRRGMVKVAKLTSNSKTVLDGKEEKTADESPLTGKLFSMAKPPQGDWNFELDGSVPLSRIQSEIDELKVYLKRDWYPAREINVGESWEFDPAWIKMLIERDMSKAKTIGTMSLRQVRNTEKRRLAVIDVSIRSTGGNFRSDGTESEASIELKGEVIVNLETMLDEVLELNGTIVTGTSTGLDSTKVKLPIRLVATKSFVKDLPLP